MKNRIKRNIRTIVLKGKIPVVNGTNRYQDVKEKKSMSTMRICLIRFLCIRTNNSNEDELDKFI
jgi:hypothetical protein